MKTKLALFAWIFALAFAPILSAQTLAPVTTSPAIGDITTAYRSGTYGNDLRASYALWQIAALFPPVAGPGISVAPYGTNTGQSQVSLSLINSPSVALGYSTGVGAGQTVTQLTNKSTAVVMPANCFTGTITMNNASLANGAVVKFTVTDSAVAASDIVTASPQQGSITASAAYLVTCNANNGSFVVNVYNA